MTVLRTNPKLLLKDKSVPTILGSTTTTQTCFKQSGTKDLQQTRGEFHCVQTLLPNKMLRSIILVTLLISSVCALDWEMHKEESNGIEIEEGSGDVQTQQLPGMCWACKWAMKKLKRQISNGATPDEIKKKLSMVCDEIGFLKSLCRKFVNKYTDTLIEELSTTDDAGTICANISVCKK
ncbi:hypothetical protein R3I93_010762 [Phoxinus phoxinus]|uniref:Saposin B-type domain-containing protein n=2 Tax=Phoxinus phoxinus TaxID=58324 RepID=A0AAN9D1E6_9TELE